MDVPVSEPQATRPNATGGTMNRHPIRRASFAAACVATLGIASVANAQSPSPGISSAAVWPGFKGGPGHDGVGTGGPTGQPVLRWRYQAQGAANQPVAVGDGLAFTSTDDGILHALDLATGTERWSLTADHAPFGGPLFADDTLYVFDGIGVAHAYDPATGTERWHGDASVGIASNIELADGSLFVGTDTGLDAIDAGTGTVRWTYTPPEGGGVHSPAIADGLVYASTDQAGYIAVDEATGKLAWKHDTGTDNVGTAVVADGVTFVGAADDPPGHLTALDARTGAVLWSDDEQLHSPAVADGVAIGGGPIGLVVAHDVQTGKELWRTPIADKTRPVAIADGVAYVAADTQHKVYALDAATGKELWWFDVDAGLDCCIAVADGAVFVGTGLGGVYAIGGSDDPAVPSGAPVASPVAPQASMPAPSIAAGPAFQGTWHTDPLTEDQVAAAFVAAGGTDADGRDFFHAFGLDPTTHVTIQIILDEGSVSQSGIGDAGIPAIGSHGNYDLAPDGTFTLREEACVQPFSSELSGDSLTLRSLSSCEGDGVYNVTLYGSFPFHRGPAPKAETTPSPAPSAVAGIPDGRYTTGLLTSAQIEAATRAAGYDPAAGDLMGHDWVFTVQFDSGRLLIVMQEDGGPPSIGWQGHYRFLDDHTMEAHDGMSTITYDFRLDGDVLTMRLLDDTLQDPGELAAQSGVYDTAPFTRVH